jgi:ABC-2 type transport system ATP-binding protein
LKVRGLSRRYGQLEALRDFELEMAAGECVALIGRNGSGKTTALRMIAGLLEPSAGEVEVVGADVHHEPAALTARAAMAVVPDTPMLYSDLTVGEHLELVATAHGVAGGDLNERIDGVLSALGLEGRRDSRPGQLSRGMRQKVQLACALIRPFQLLLLDEPVVGLDPESQQTLRELLLAAKVDGIAVLLTTHQLDFARGIADRAVLLGDGEVIAAGEYEEVAGTRAVKEWGLE